MKTNSLLAIATLASATLASSAHAHINATLGDTAGRNGNQKLLPCDGDRGTGPTFTFAPGAMIDINVSEYVPHPGYFRIAFDVDGEDFIAPRSIDPVEKSRDCPFGGAGSKDQCGESDHCNNETVLWDNLAPHPAGFPGSYKWTIQLPDVECDNCTLQVIQVMEDTVHGAYCPYDTCKDDSLEDIYARCFDIKLEKGAKSGPGLSTKPLTLPADKKYIDCKKAGEPTEPVTNSDASTPPDARDSGSPEEDPGEGSTDAAVDTSGDENEGEDEGGEVEPKKDAGAKKDAGVKRDAGKASSDDEPAASSDSGCALATSSKTEGAIHALLLLGLVLARRRFPRVAS